MRPQPMVHSSGEARRSLKLQVEEWEVGYYYTVVMGKWSTRSIAILGQWDGYSDPIVISMSKEALE